MSPTLLPGQKVLVNKLSYMLSKPEIGDIVVVKNPEDGRLIIKRVTGIESGKYVVHGDNPKKSTDSRMFGSLTRRAIIGKVIYS